MFSPTNWKILISKLIFYFRGRTPYLSQKGSSGRDQRLRTSAHHGAFQKTDCNLLAIKVTAEVINVNFQAAIVDIKGRIVANIGNTAVVFAVETDIDCIGTIWQHCAMIANLKISSRKAKLAPSSVSVDNLGDVNK